MKHRSFHQFLKALLRTILGGIAGATISLLLYGTFIPFWTVSSIGSAPSDAVSILFVDYQYAEASHLDTNPIYVQSQSQKIYFGLPNNWEVLSSLPNGHSVSKVWRGYYGEHKGLLAVSEAGEAYKMINGNWALIQKDTDLPIGFTHNECAKKWVLPVLQGIDSTGTVFSHALADEYVCYVLLRDGHLQVWTRTTDVFSMLFIFIIGTLLGMFIGFRALSIKNFLYRKNTRSSIQN